MVYSSESSKWKAYQFSDPFAAYSFFVGNKVSKKYCRPDCDARPDTNLKSEIKFLNNVEEAASLGYGPCEYCDPTSAAAIDVQLLINTVAAVNEKIGFMPPLLDDNEERNNKAIKENIVESRKVGDSQYSRRSSLPAINYDGKFSKDFENISLSKNDSDHYRLVDLACRHLALAAAMNTFQPQTSRSSKNNDESSPNSKKRKRRGGVLGFKELAAKSKLSAWHFHRVFKSVTGLTPKTYGDKCWEYLKTLKESGEVGSFVRQYTPPSALREPATPEDALVLPSSKKVKIESPLNDNLTTSQYSSIDATSLSPNDNGDYQVPTLDAFDMNHLLMNNNFNLFDQNGGQDQSGLSKTFSVPDLGRYGYENLGLANLNMDAVNTIPPSLFDHNQRADPSQVNGTSQQETPALNLLNDVSSGEGSSPVIDNTPLSGKQLGLDYTLMGAPLSNDLTGFTDLSLDSQFNMGPALFTTDLLDAKSVL